MDWSKFIAVNGATAHPHYDPDGTAYNMGNSYGSKGFHSRSRLTRKSKPKQICTDLFDFYFIPGALYNIIRVPPEKQEASDTLQGAKVLCSIVPKDKSHPSYYHSFGELHFFPASLKCLQTTNLH